MPDTGQSSVTVKLHTITWTTVACEKLDPLFFLNNSLNIQHRTRTLLGKLTQVILQSGMKHGLSGIHICRIIQEKQGFYFFARNCNGIKQEDFYTEPVYHNP